MIANNTMPSVIDLEASGLGEESYPVEVGVVLSDGRLFCSLVKPEEGWDYWDEVAESLHHVRREQLFQYGRSTTQVAQQLNELLDGQTAYSDTLGNDVLWLDRLFQAAGIEQSFKVESLFSLLSEEQQMVWNRTKQHVIDQFSFTRHRASADARILQETYLQTLQAIE